LKKLAHLYVNSKELRRMTNIIIFPSKEERELKEEAKHEAFAQDVIDIMNLEPRDIIIDDIEEHRIRWIAFWDDIEEQAALEALEDE